MQPNAPLPHAPPFTTPQAPYPAPAGAPPPLPVAGPAATSKPPASDFPELPELPSVPGSLPPGGASAGGADVDFDDLTKRFEDLKRRK